MMKKKLLLFFIVAAICDGLGAQTYTNMGSLKISAQRLNAEHQSNYAKALQLAKEKNWDFEKKSSDGRLAKLSGVDEFGCPVYIRSNSSLISAITTRANQLWPGGTSGLNLSGSTPAMQNKIGIWEFDGAPLATHVEFNGRILQKETPGGSSGNDHATHVAGIIISKGLNPLAKGTAYELPNLISHDYLNDFSEVAADCAAGLLISNHSYGVIAGWDYNTSSSRWEFYGRDGENEDYKYGYYSKNASIIDSLHYNAPNYTMVISAGNDRSSNGPAVGSPYYRYDASNNMVSAGNRPSGMSSNDGYDIIAGNAVAKNALTVGAVNGLPNGYNKPSDVVMSSFSAWGPTDDGRIKPDFVTNGVGVLSTISTSSTSYSTYSGTSMASPSATGSLALLQELYTKLRPNSFMRSATLKALAIHTTDEAGTSDGPDYKFGWGLLNVERAASVLNNALTNNNAATSNDLVFEKVLSSGQSFTTTVVASGKVPLKATIAWTDPIASVNTIPTTNLNDRTRKLVNDLDIVITRAGQTFLPWTLDVTSPAWPAQRGNNNTDNVERIDVDSTIPGETYTITISHKNASLARGMQAYSLIISGAGGVAYCASQSNPAGGSVIDSVSFSSIHSSANSSCRSYTNNTHLTGTIQSKQVIPFYIRLKSCDGTTNNRMVKIFVDYNNDGDFLDANETVATSAVLNASTTNFSGNIIIPADLTIGALSLMRVIVQETTNAAVIAPCGNYSKGETQDFKLKVVAPTNDMAIAGIVSPELGACGNPAQYLTVSIANYGSVDQSNIPVTATIKNGTTTVATLSAIYPGTITASSVMDYTFQTPFATAGGNSYTITVNCNLASDQNSTNNQFQNTIPLAAKPVTPQGTGAICSGTNAMLSTISPLSTSRYFWYTTNTDPIPFATGTSVSASTITSDKTYYLGSEFRSSVGPSTKMAYSSGGYNGFDGNFMKFNNSVPLTIETVKLYIGYPGKIKFTVADNFSTSGTSGSYNYHILNSKTIDVYATTPNPAQGAVSVNNAADTGAVYYLNLNVPVTGDKILIVECMDQFGNHSTTSNPNPNISTIFRNDAINGTTYPLGINGIMSFTGNSASLTGGVESKYFYFFYDTRISTGCVSDRSPVVATVYPDIVLTKTGDSITSNVTSGIAQWIFNDTETLLGISGYSIKPTKSGNYKLTVTDGQGCTRTSTNFNYTVTGLTIVSPAAIGLAVSPNPNNGVFQISFEVNTVSDLSMEILNEEGQRIYLNSQPQFIGKFNKQISLKNTGSGLYLLKIQHNKKTYLQKIIIAH